MDELGVSESRGLKINPLLAFSCVIYDFPLEPWAEQVSVAGLGLAGLENSS
jgi:hypothetical protein